MKIERPAQSRETTDSRDASCPVGAGDVLAQRYSVEHLIGEGTFGWVFSALDVGSTPARRVAIKVLKNQHAVHDNGVRRFERRELELLRRVQEQHPSPHVVRALVPELLSHGGLPYLVLEHIDGPTLRERLDGAPLEPGEIRRIGLGLARGLAAIHAAGGVHRDLKPTNIRLRDGSEPVIVDLGITRALWETQEFTATGLAPMTPRYASPEQLRGQVVHPASDIYSLGMILHELLTDELPPGTQDLLPPRGARPIPPGMMKCARRCLARDPRRRPTALEVAAMLAAPPRASPRLRALRGALIVSTALLMLAWLAIRPRSIAPPSILPPPPWSQSLGNADEVRRMYAAPDSTGGIFVAGSFRSTLHLGDTILTSAGLDDVFLARFDSSGRLLWSKRAGDAGWQGVTAIAVGPDDNFFVAGNFDGVLDLGGQPLTNFGSTDIYLACLTPEGHLLWSKRFGDLSDQIPASMAIDAEGNVTIAGTFHGTVDFGGGALVSAGLSDVFLARFSPGGRLLWSQRFGDSQRQYANFVSVDNRGHILLSGAFEGTIDLGGELLASAGLRDDFMAVFDANGHHLWSRRDGDAADQPGHLTVFDPEGHIDILKAVEGSPPGSSVLLLHRLASDGTPLWTRSFGPLEHTFSDVEIGYGPKGRIVIAGSIQGDTNFGDGPFSGLGGSDLFVLELAPDGTLLESRRFGDAAHQDAHSIRTDRWGNIIIDGAFEGTLDFGNGSLAGDGHPNLFITRLAPSTAAPLTPEDSDCLPPPEGLAAWYPFDAPGSSSEVGAPPGKLVGQTRAAPGRVGQALLLEQGYFEAAANPAFDVGRGAFSVSTWVRTSDATRTRIILDKRSEPDSGGYVTGYSLFLQRGRLSLQLGDGSGIGGCVIEANGSCTNYFSGRFLADGAWHLVSVTVERGSPRGGIFYVDGAEVSRFDPTQRPGSLDNDHPLRVGSRSSSETGLFRGLIDEVALWKRALSPSEVASLYRAGRAGMCRAQSSEPSRSP